MVDKAQKELSLREIERGKLIPWALNFRTIRKIVQADFDGPNLMGASITTVAGRRQFLVAPRGLQTYLQEFIKPKQIYGRKRNEAGRASARPRSKKN